jgi:hypothetical protein
MHVRDAPLDAVTAPAARDTRWLEVAALGAVAGVFAVAVRSTPLVVPLLPPLLVLHGLLLARRAPVRARAASFALLVAVIVVLPTLDFVGLAATGRLQYEHDGGVTITDRAVEHLLAGRDPYAVSYEPELRDQKLLIDGLLVPNPAGRHYPYGPLTFLLQVPVQAPLRALGIGLDARWLYLPVHLAVIAALAAWSLRRRGDLLPAILIGLNPAFVMWSWYGETDVWLLAGLVVMAWALSRDRPGLAGLALGFALATKLLLAPVAVVLVVWLAGKVVDRRLPVATVVRVLAGLLLPALVTALPFLLWHRDAFLEDVLWFHLGRTVDRWPIVGAGFPALLFDLDVLTDRYAPAPLWSTLLPTVAATLGTCRWLWRREGTQALFAAAAGLSLATVWFSRVFSLTYWWLPMTLLVLAALVPSSRLTAEGNGWRPGLSTQRVSLNSSSGRTGPTSHSGRRTESASR